MKKLLPFFLLILAGCGVQVDDLGNYWNKGGIDPVLAGKWLEAAGSNKNEVITVARKDGAYQVEGDATKKPEMILMKTMRVGDYRFLIIGPTRTYTLLSPTEGKLARYVVKGDKWFGYSPNIEAMDRFLKEKYPQEKNIAVHDHCEREHKKETCFDSIEIHQLDEETLKILSDIPNDGIYWDGGLLFTRIHE